MSEVQKRKKKRKMSKKKRKRLRQLAVMMTFVTAAVLVLSLIIVINCISDKEDIRDKGIAEYKQGKVVDGRSSIQNLRKKHGI